MQVCTRLHIFPELQVTDYWFLVWSFYRVKKKRNFCCVLRNKMFHKPDNDERGVGMMNCHVNLTQIITSLNRILVHLFSLWNESVEPVWRQCSFNVGRLPWWTHCWFRKQWQSETFMSFLLLQAATWDTSQSAALLSLFSGDEVQTVPSSSPWSLLLVASLQRRCMSLMWLFWTGEEIGALGVNSRRVPWLFSFTSVLSYLLS